MLLSVKAKLFPLSQVSLMFVAHNEFADSFRICQWLPRKF